MGITDANGISSEQDCQTMFHIKSSLVHQYYKIGITTHKEKNKSKNNSLPLQYHKYIFILFSDNQVKALSKPT